jgi:hypothetical protein
VLLLTLLAALKLAVHKYHIHYLTSHSCNVPQQQENFKLLVSLGSSRPTVSVKIEERSNQYSIRNMSMNDVLTSLTSESYDSIDKKKNRAPSLIIFLMCFWLYAISYTLVIPAFPSLLLEVTHGESDLASVYYGTASCLRYMLEFFSSPYLGNLSDSIGRKKILILSLLTMCLEFLLLALYPSVGTIFVVSVISG